jgi:hypothetical protein
MPATTWWRPPTRKAARKTASKLMSSILQGNTRHVCSVWQSVIFSERSLSENSLGNPLVRRRSKRLSIKLNSSNLTYSVFYF